jgi:hypothetical protein
MRTRIALVISITLAVAGTARAQLTLPQPSPLAKVSQVVGLTEISVEYSSPAVKGRKIWGGLLPYDELWRTGANSATKVTFSKDVTVADSPVPAGTYALFTIPSKTSWTVILNKNPNQGGTRDYKKELDLVRFTVKPQPAAHRERLAFQIEDFSDNAASLDIEWEKVRVRIPIKLTTDAQALANIKSMTDNAWRPYTNAARYLLEAKKDYPMAMELVDKSIGVKEDWLNVWTKAQILAAQGKYKDAYPLAEKANALGQKAEFFFFQDDVMKALSDWKGKS